MCLAQRSVSPSQVLVLCSTLSWLMGLPCAQCTDTFEALKRLEGAGCCSCKQELCHSPCPVLASAVQVSDPQPVPEHGVTVVFVELPNTKIELLHPLGDKSPIQKFLERNPAGGCRSGTAPSSQPCMLAVSRWCTHGLRCQAGSAHQAVSLQYRCSRQHDPQAPAVGLVSTLRPPPLHSACNMVRLLRVCCRRRGYPPCLLGGC